MDFLVWVISGSIVGWLAHLTMDPDARQNLTLDVVAGVVGAVAGGWLLAPLVGASAIAGSVSAAGMFVSLAGAVVMLAILTIVKHADLPDG